MLALIAAIVFAIQLIFTPDTSFSLVVLGLCLMALHLAFPLAIGLGRRAG